ILDYAAGARTHLGGFVAQVLDGTAGATLLRKAAALVAPFLTSPVALAALLVGVGVVAAAAWWVRRTLREARAGAGPYAWLAAFSTPGWLGPALRALAVLVVVEVVVNDSGLTMLMYSAIAAVPALTALLTSRAAVTPGAADTADTPGA
ncbi:hypothetical protein RWX45_00580, partial [Actinomyces sp. MRS3W]|nr:hypothetical protein [Actinomyces sp. MRS3W]